MKEEILLSFRPRKDFYLYNRKIKEVFNMLTEEKMELFMDIENEIKDLEYSFKEYTIVNGEDPRYFPMKFNTIKQLINELKELED